MKVSIQTCLVLLLIGLTALNASAQLAQIQTIPGQIDDEWGYNGYVAVEAANGDIVAIYTKNGEIETLDFPWTGKPAELKVTRSSDGGATWSDTATIRTAIPVYGMQYIGFPNVVVQSNGRIDLNFNYILAPFPNFDQTTELWHSDDNGITWLFDGTTDALLPSATSPGGLPVAFEYRERPDFGFDIWTSTYDEDFSVWSNEHFLADADPICGIGYLVESDTNWTFIYSDCVFGYGGTNRTYLRKTTDAGANWSAPTELMTSDSGFGTLGNGSLLSAPDGTWWLVYSNGPVISYRTSTDGGTTWSEATNWTAGDENVVRDLTPSCSMTSQGPLCVFEGRRGTVNQLIQIGIPGVSRDPLMGPVAIDADLDVPESFALDQNYPNPFNPSTTITYELAAASNVRLALFDLLGREIQVLVSGNQSAGHFEVQLDATGLPSGTYLYRLVAGNHVETRRMVVAK